MISLWPKLTVQFAPTQVVAPVRTGAPEAALPSPAAPVAPPSANKPSPAKQERPETPRGEGASSQPSQPAASSPNKLPSYPLESSKNTPATLTAGPVRAATAKVNLNTASQAELESLPRVGPAMSERIIEGRPYRSLEDLDKVKGVGPKLLLQLAPLVTF